MKRVIVENLIKQSVIADKCIVAESFLERFIGLIGKRGLRDGEGMLFRGCNSVHMWFMRFPIDIVFLARDGRVSSMRPRVRAWRPLPLLDVRAADCIELPAGTIERLGIERGDAIRIGAHV